MGIPFQQCLCKWLSLKTAKSNCKILECDLTRDIEQLLNSLVGREIDLG